MLKQLADQLQAAEGRPVIHDNLVPFIVLISFLLTGWIVYTGVVADVIWYLDIHPSEAAIEFSPSVNLNVYTFDQEINPDWYYTQGYGYSK